MAPRPTPTHEETMAAIDAHQEAQGGGSVLGRMARLYDVSEDDPRLYQMVSKLAAKGIDPNDWVDSKVEGRQAKSRPVEAIDPRGMRTKGSSQLSRGLTGTEAAGYLPPTADEALGLDEGPQKPSLAGRAVAAAYGTASDPVRRRQFERGLSDSVTFGAAEKIARSLGGALGDDSFSEAQAYQDEQEAPGTRVAGQLAGSFAPGATSRVAGTAGRAGMKLASKIAHGPVGGAAVGAAAGAASAPVVSGALALGRGAVEATDEDTTLGDAFSGAWRATKETATDPISMVLGAAGGALGGGAVGLRKGDSQTSRDIRLREEHGGVPSISQGARGGDFENPRIRGIRGTPENVGEVARESADTIRSALNKRMKEAGAAHEARLNEARANGSLAGRLDATDIEDTARKILKSTRTTSATAAKIEADVLAPLEPFKDPQTGRITMSAEDLIDLKGRLADVAEMGSRGSKVAKPKDVQLGKIWSTADDILSQTDVDQILGPYAKASQRNMRAHNQLRLGAKSRTAPLDEVASHKLAELLTRRAQNTKTAGKENAQVRRFMKENPDLAPEVMAPALLGAKERLRFRIPEGDLIQAARGIPTANIEPLLGNVAYPLGAAAGRNAGYAQALKNPLERGWEAYQEEQRKRAAKLKAGGR